MNYLKFADITLLIQKIIELLKNFREDEIKSGEMPLTRSRIQEIVILLQNTKTLEVFPNINLIEKNEIKKDNFDEITVYDVISKSKKIHLFYLQSILIEFIDTKELEIKSLIKEIFLEINNLIALPKLSVFGK